MDEFHDPYFSDGYLLEACYALADAGVRHGRRIDDSVRVVVFAALSAEAHVNLAIETGLSGAVQEIAQSLNMPMKLRLVPQLAAGIELDPGSEPLGGVRQLVTRRNRLVHATPPVWTMEGERNDDWTISIKNAHGASLAEGARFISSLCSYLGVLGGAGLSAWRGYFLLAREISRLESALRDWDTDSAIELRSLLDRIVDSDLE